MSAEDGKKLYFMIWEMIEKGLEVDIGGMREQTEFD